MLEEDTSFGFTSVEYKNSLVSGFLNRSRGHFDIFGTGYVPLGRVLFSPFLLPSWVSFSAKMFPKGYTISKSLPVDKTTMVILLPDRVFKVRKCSQTG